MAGRHLAHGRAQIIYLDPWQDPHLQVTHGRIIFPFLQQVFRRFLPLGLGGMGATNCPHKQNDGSPSFTQSVESTPYIHIYIYIYVYDI